MSIQSISEIIKDSPLFRQIADRASLSTQLNDYLQQYLSVSLMQHCHVGSFQGGHLIIYIDNAIWSLELRSKLGELHKQLKTHPELSSLTKITYSVDPTIK